METRDLFHGTNGDNILAIMREGLLRPNHEGKIYFSERRFDSVLMHGADMKRKATFAVKLRVTIPTSAASPVQQQRVLPKPFGHNYTATQS